MGFPLDIRTDLFVGGTWQDISPDVYLREVKNLVRGIRDMGSTADPSSLTMTLDNRAGKYSQRNAMSPLFGLIGRNTPIRVSLPSSEDHYLQQDGRAGCNATTPDAAALDITGDLDVRAEIAPDWYGPANQMIFGKWDRDAAQESWAVHIHDGQIGFLWSSDGATSFGVEKVLPLSLPERAAIRVVFDADNGSGAFEIRFYWAESLDAPSGWTFIGQQAILGTGSIFASTSPLTIGLTGLSGTPARPRTPMHGRGYRYQVRNGIDGTVVASPDFRAATPGATSLVDSSGRTWTLSGSAEIRDREDRFLGEVSEWPLRWSTDDADRYAPITANGILRRLGQGVKALDSTLRRRIPSGNPIAYWPMEEQNDAVQAYSPIPGVLPASVSSVEWAGFDSLPSSAPLPKLTGASSLSATVPAATPGQWHVEMVYTADDIIPIGTDVEVLKVYSADGAIRRWEILMRNGRATVRGYNWANVKVIEKLINVGADVFHGWVRLRFYAFDSGGSLVWSVGWQDVGGDAGFYSSSYTGSCGSVSLLAADWPALTEGWGVGHLAVLAEANSSLYTGSDNAYRGETAFERMRRLGVEEKLSVTRTPGRLPVERIGFQRQDSMVSLFEAAADGDGGLLTEDMRRIGLHYRDRSSLYAQDPLITLSYVEPGLGPDLEPVDDDSEVRNDVTVSRDGGSSARAVLAEGPLSVQPAPDGIGKYDATYTISLDEDGQTDYHAYWKLHLGTWDGARYPSVTLQLHKPGAEWLIPLVMRLREGDKIRLTDLPQWVSHDDVDLLVMGWSEQLDMYRWDVELNCVPAGPWDTAVTDQRKADTDGTVLELSATDTATSLVTRTVAGPQWADAPEHLPYSIRVAGEVMTVTAVSPTGLDAFGRTVSNGWGAADSGGSWVSTGGAASDRSVSSGRGVITLPSSVSSVRAMTLPISLRDVEVRCRIQAAQVSTGASMVPGVVFRWASANECYRARVHFGTSGSMFVSITRGTTTLGSQPSLPYTYVANSEFEVRAQVIGHTVRIKAWPVGAEEPEAWNHTATVTDTPIASGQVGLSGSGFAGVTNVSPTVRYDNFQITDLQTMTVVRSTNGVVKAQASGTAVNIAARPFTSL
ncbi:hypothetical protein ACQEV9_15610 [Streptomyces chartreusis]|uniref:hypothetical protein n=1 Tax=Streptomyces chartreusis TaxID=1969 RepID=UPI003D926FC9